MSHWKWRETKLQPSRARSGHQISCCLVSLHFLRDILAPITVKSNSTRYGKKMWVLGCVNSLPRPEESRTRNLWPTFLTNPVHDDDAFFPYLLLRAYRNVGYYARLRPHSSLEVERSRFLRITIPVPWGILEELEPELKSKES